MNKKEYYKNHYKERKDYYIKKAMKWKKENPEKVKESRKKYYMKNKDKIKKRRFKNINKIRKREKAYRDTKEYKERRNKYLKDRLKKDILFHIKTRLRNTIRVSIDKYSKTGKIISSKEYGIDYESIINHLKPFPADLSKYHIDHIIPLCSFDLTNTEEVKKAFAPKNHQWLLAKDNISKGKKIEIQKRINLNTLKSNK